jgi:hypothetical protein
MENSLPYVTFKLIYALLDPASFVAIHMYIFVVVFVTLCMISTPSEDLR